MRSESHGLVVGAFLGFGIVVASQFLFAAFNDRGELPGPPSSDVLSLPLILSWCIILGVRYVLDVPGELRANWIFRINLDPDRQEGVPLARNLILTLVLPWVVAFVLPVYSWLWGWRAGVWETLVVAIWSWVLTDFLLLRFRKIPFTCSYPPFRDSSGLLVVFCVLGFFAYVVLTANMVRMGLSEPLLMFVVVGIGLAALFALGRIRRTVEAIDRHLIFEEKPPASFTLLDLRRGT